MFKLFKKKKIKYLSLNYLDLSDDADIEKQILTVHNNCVMIERKVNELIKLLNKDKYIIISPETVEKRSD